MCLLYHKSLLLYEINDLLAGPRLHKTFMNRFSWWVIMLKKPGELISFQLEKALIIFLYQIYFILLVIVIVSQLINLLRCRTNYEVLLKEYYAYGIKYTLIFFSFQIRPKTRWQSTVQKSWPEQLQDKEILSNTMREIPLASKY